MSKSTASYVELTGFPGELRQEWFNPAEARSVNGPVVPGGARRRFESAFSGDAVLYLHSAGSPRTALGLRQR